MSFLKNKTAVLAFTLASAAGLSACSDGPDVTYTVTCTPANGSKAEIDVTTAAADKVYLQRAAASGEFQLVDEGTFQKRTLTLGLEGSPEQVRSAQCTLSAPAR